MTPDREARLRARAADALGDVRKLGYVGAGGNRPAPARSRACPDCGAQPDRACINARTGGPMASHHRGRLQPPATTKGAP